MTELRIPENKVVFAADDHFAYPTHSTVGELIDHPDLVTVLREGVYSKEQIAASAREVQKWSWEDPRPGAM